MACSFYEDVKTYYENTFFILNQKMIENPDIKHVEKWINSKLDLIEENNVLVIEMKNFYDCEDESTFWNSLLQTCAFPQKDKFDLSEFVKEVERWKSLMMR